MEGLSEEDRQRLREIWLKLFPELAWYLKKDEN